MDYEDMDGVGEYGDEEGHMGYGHHDMMGSDDDDGHDMHGNSYG